MPKDWKKKEGPEEGEDKNNVSISHNRKARFDYEILETLEAGLVLKGTEVRSLRDGLGTIQGAFARERDGNLTLESFEIPPWRYAHEHDQHDPLRSKRLLLKREQLNRLLKSVASKGLALVALKVYFKDGKVKVELGLGRGKKASDKRQIIKDREEKRYISRATKRYR
ncbi:MAG: SsrA-binding protein SmpB [Planctomycetota bacterium]